MEQVITIELRVVIASISMPKGVSLTVDLILPYHRRRASFPVEHTYRRFKDQLFQDPV